MDRRTTTAQSTAKKARIRRTQSDPRRRRRPSPMGAKKMARPAVRANLVADGDSVEAGTCLATCISYCQQPPTSIATPLGSTHSPVRTIEQAHDPEVPAIEWLTERSVSSDCQPVCCASPQMERKTGFEPATLTLARWPFASQESATLPCRAVLFTRFSPRPMGSSCSSALYYRRGYLAAEQTGSELPT